MFFGRTADSSDYMDANILSCEQLCGSKVARQNKTHKVSVYSFGGHKKHPILVMVWIYRKWHISKVYWRSGVSFFLCIRYLMFYTIRFIHSEHCLAVVSENLCSLFSDFYRTTASSSYQNMPSVDCTVLKSCKYLGHFIKCY